MSTNEKAPPRSTARPEAKNVHDRPSKRNPDLRVVQSAEQDDDDVVGVEGFKPLLPADAWFEAKLAGWRTAILFNCPKVFWKFEIVSPSEWNGARVFRAFRVRKLVGRPSPQGKFVAAAGGDLYQTLARLLDCKTRADRISLRPLKYMLFKIRLRTVCTNSRQEDLPEHARYSTVCSIERAE
ncbi:MAG: hypothetical protein ABJA83_09040 [Burkholderiaceae bacterium]